MATPVQRFVDSEQVRAIEHAHAPPAPRRRAARGRHVVDERLPQYGPDLSAPCLFVMALGLFVQGIATAVGRHGGPDPVTDNIFWVSLLLIFGPAAARVLARSTGRTELLTLAIATPVVLALSRWLLYPTDFVWHDELAHANTLRQLASSGHLFSTNPLLPVSAYYPGLELATDGVQALTGLSPRFSALLVLLVARVLLTLAVIGIIERISGSVRAAAIGSLVYACNPQFLFFNSQYSYQTLALPLALVVCWLLVMRRPGSPPAVLAPALAVVVAVTHHLTCYLLLAVLALWLVVSLISRDRTIDRRSVLLTWAAGTIAAVGWILVPGNPVLGYLGEIYGSSAHDLNKLSHGQQTHVIFSDFSGDRTPAWQQMTLMASVIITCLVLPWALWNARVWWRRRSSAAIVLTLSAALYPLIPAGHLTFATSEVFDRSSGFLYPGVALAVGYLISVYREGPVGRLLQGSVAAAVLAFLFVGGVILGSGPRWNRIPGPYLVAADPRSVDSYNIAAAEWMRTGVPPDSRVLSDRVGRLLDAALGGQHSVTYISDPVNASGLLLAPRLTREDIELARRANVQYVAVDRRLATSLPRVGVYYENGEWGQMRTAPVPIAALTKLDGYPDVMRIYDNGAIAIYDVRSLHPK